MNVNKFVGILCLAGSAMAAAMNLYFLISTLDVPLSVQTLGRIRQITPILLLGSIALAISASWFMQKRPVGILRFFGLGLFLAVCGQMFGVVFTFLLASVWERALRQLM
jgi:hypothetical protein